MVWLIVALRTGALIDSIVDRSLPRYLEVHNAVSIAVWSASGLTLAMERNKGVAAHHWSLCSFWGCSFINAAFSLHLVVLQATIDLISSTQVLSLIHI